MHIIGHGRARILFTLSAGGIFVLMPALRGQQAQPSPPPQGDTCALDADGTARITRVVPLPGTISPEAQKFISRPGPSGPETSLAERRARTDAFRKARSEEALKLFPVNVEAKTIGGVRCDILTPLSIPPEKSNLVLINVHGGGFNSDSGSLVEGVPIANLAGIRVVSVYYRLAPEHPFPAAVDDTVAVYRELLKTYKPKNMALFGTSAGAILTPEVAVALRQKGLPLPGALGVFSGTGDMSQRGDSESLFSLMGLPSLFQPPSKGQRDDYYLAGRNPRDPMVSPLYADLDGFPPTLFITSTRDALLSGTTILHRAFLRAGVDARLVVFEALPHAFWYDYHLPESMEAIHIMAKFFDDTVGR